jgi:serine protease Do
MQRHDSTGRRTLIAAGAVFMLGACAACTTWGSGAAPGRRDAPVSFAAALARAMPAVVGVYGVGDSAAADLAQGPTADLAPEAPDLLETTLSARIGAGFFIAADGLVVTAAHVVAGAKDVIVGLPDQRIVRASTVGIDAGTDIALLRVPVTLPAPPPLGTSVVLRAGDWVLAVGEPYGMDRSVVAGIVGGRGRHFAEDAELLYIQSDLALNPGNSGGPLLDMQGSIVAMNLRTVVGAIGSPGLSLSVPIEVVQQIVAELADHGRRRRPRLGAVFEDVQPVAAFAAGRATASGALLSSVTPGSLAQRLGLRAGDIVVAMNGSAIGDSADLVRVLLAWTDVEHTRVTVFRGGRYVHLRLKPEPRP